MQVNDKASCKQHMKMSRRAP